MKGSGVGLFAQEFVCVVDVVYSGWVGWWKIKRIGGVCVNVNGALPMHKGAEREDEEFNVGAVATLINVKPPDVFVVVNVMADE